MDDFEEIKNALGSFDDDMIKDEYDDTNDSRLAITNTDPIETLSARVSMLVSENADLKMRLKKLEDTVKGLVAGRNESTSRSRITIPKRDLFGPKPPVETATPTSPASSVIEMPSSRAPSISGYSNTGTGEFINPLSLSLYSEPGRMIMSKSTSATAPMGYDRKASVWGTALASMLIGATRFYISKTNASGVMIDELRLMKNCTIVAPIIFSTAMHKELPGVKDGITKYLSESISRVDKNEVPISNAEDWYNLEQNPYGKEVMSRLNTIITVAKQVPEVIMHPVSQVVSILIPPVIRNVDGEVKFGMYAKQPVNPIPNQWEKWCLVLKSAALVKYTKYRLSGMTESAVMSKMTTEMKPSELVEKKNLIALNEMTMPINGDMNGDF